MNAAPRDASINATAANTVVANIKLPEIWQAGPELHFVTSQTAKLDRVIGALPPPVITIVRDIRCSPPPQNPYDVLKTELIRPTYESEQWRLQQRLTSEELGERKPTELLRRMQHLIGDRSAALGTSIFRELFL